MKKEAPQYFDDFFTVLYFWVYLTGKIFRENIGGVNFLESMFYRNFIFKSADKSAVTFKK
jgi:hypothetical protein